jgi:hypothetical protein
VADATDLVKLTTATALVVNDTLARKVLAAILLVLGRRRMAELTLAAVVVLVTVALAGHVVTPAAA